MFRLKFFKKKLNVLISGRCAKDFSIAKALSNSPYLNKLYYWGKNVAIEPFAENIGAFPTPEIKNFLKEKKIDLVITQADIETILGTFDVFNYVYGVPCIAVNKHWSQLESSKYFAKQFMHRNNIKTPKYEIIASTEDYLQIADNFGFPVVIKQNALARGFGVFIANNKEEALKIIEENLQKGHFEINDKSSPNKLIIEQFIAGKEISQMFLWDGKTLVHTCPIRDYKKSKENNLGINTGGLGAVAPVPLTIQEQQLLNNYTKKFQKALKKEKATNFTGIIYAGLMFANDDIYTLEYNVRLGDPEAQVLIEHLDSDLLEIFYLLGNRKAHKIKLKYKTGRSIGVVLCTNNYINLTDTEQEEITLPQIRNNKITYNIACRNIENNKITYKGPARPITLTCTDENNPKKIIYEEIKKFDELNTNLYYRKDIGFDVFDDFKD